MKSINPLSARRRNPRQRTIETMERRELMTANPLTDVQMPDTDMIVVSSATPSRMAVANARGLDDYGNDFANATRVPLDPAGSARVLGAIERPGDQDMIRFVATTTGRMTITQNATPGSSLDTYLYVYDGNCNLLARDDDSGPALNSCVEIDVVAGRTYFVRADAFGSSTGRYELAMTTRVQDDHGNDFANATNVPLDSAGSGRVLGSIERPNDQDMIRIVATRSGPMTITQNASPGSSLDTYLYVYDGNGNLLARDDDSGPALNSRVEIDVVAGQTYFVRADAFGSSTGRYELTMTTGVQEDYGNDFANATNVSLDSAGSGGLSGAIERAGDQDMIRIVATTTGRMTITQNATPGSSLDTYLYVYDGNGNLLARDDDSGPALNSRVGIDVVAGQTYFVRADAYGSSTGRYELSLNTATGSGRGGSRRV